MCTVSWLFSPSGEEYDLFSNRDESFARRASAAPRRAVIDGVRVLAPEDGEAGGSWISVNDRGLALCLLNLYEAPLPDLSGTGLGFVSRGKLVTTLATLPDVAAVEADLAMRPLRKFRPFTLLSLAPGRQVSTLRWDGRDLNSLGDAPPMPLTSSGVDAAGAHRERTALLDRLRGEQGALTPELLLRFHKSHQPERGAYSPCMHRQDAKTVSLSWIKVGERTISFAYAAGSPCTVPMAAPQKIERLVAASVP